MDKIRIMTEEYVKQNSVITLNVEPQLIEVAIDEAQDVYLLPLLGTELYSKIMNMIDDGSITGSTDYKNLLDNYIYPVVLQYTIYETLPALRFKMMNKGIVTQNSDNSSPIDFEEYKYLADKVRIKAQNMGERLVEFLEYYYPLYPEYISLNSGNVKTEHTSYSTGMYLGPNMDCCNIGKNKTYPNK